MKEIIVKFTPFVFKQIVFIKDLQTGNFIEEAIPQTEVLKYISSIKNVKEIHLFGNETYAKKIKEDCLTKYNLKNVEIKINN